MQPSEESDRLFQFGVFEADLRTGTLTRQGRRVRLQEQPFQLLAILIQQPKELVTREELRQKLWPQTTVDFDHGVNKAIGKIREALGDSASHPRFIETVARRGYRFLADVEIVREATPEQSVAAPKEVADEGKQLTVESAHFEPARLAPLSRRWILPSLLLLAATASVPLLWWKSAADQIRSIAVLPLHNLSNDPSQDYFSDGMTEELITELSQIKVLRVISRNSVMAYKNANRPLPEIARTLNVDGIVQGSVLRVGDRIRITVQLIDVAADKHILAKSFEGNITETLGLQARVARAIATQVEAAARPGGQTGTQQKAVDADAYEAYLKGRYFWNKRTVEDLKTAIGYFRRAIQADPEFAKAYSGLADSYTLLGDWEYGALAPTEAFAQATAAASKALALDGSLAEAHNSLAFAQDLFGWDWAAAEKDYRLAIDLNPGYATAHHWYGWHLIVTGRPAEGILEIKQALHLDPLSLIVSADLADAFCIVRRYDDAINQSRRTLEIDPRFALGHFELGQALTLKGLHSEAIDEFQKAIELGGHSPVFEANLAHALAAAGNVDRAAKIADELRTRYEHASFADPSIALAYLAIGDSEQAIKFLTKAFDARFNPSVVLRPTWDSIRTDARFQDLLRRAGLPT